MDIRSYAVSLCLLKSSEGKLLTDLQSLVSELFCQTIIQKCLYVLTVCSAVLAGCQCLISNCLNKLLEYFILCNEVCLRVYFYYNCLCFRQLTDMADTLCCDSC